MGDKMDDSSYETKWYNFDPVTKEVSPAAPGPFQPIAERQIAYTKLWNGTWISTVFLCMDHSWEEDGSELFETMVFPRNNWVEDLCLRCATYADALQQHKAAVEWARRENHPLVLIYKVIERAAVYVYKKVVELFTRHKG